MKKLLATFAVLISFLAAICAASPAFAALAVDVTQGNAQPIPIAIPDFAGDPAVGANVANVVRADLERSGLFRPLDQRGFTEHFANVNSNPTFESWRAIGAQGLVVGQVTQQPDGRLRVDFRLWDTSNGQQMTGQSFSTVTPESWRRLAHKVSDAIYERVTGEKGYFDSRVVFISESGPATKRVKRLAIMDEDGFNPAFLTSGSYMILTPRFNPTSNAQVIAYMSYRAVKPRVYLFDLETGREELLGNFPNMTFSPRFSPDGNRVAMSLEQGGNSDVYVMDLRTRATTRLTSDPAIDTAPSFSPDGRQIAFESDRGGSQQIYVMNADGSNQHRISFGPGANGTPVWSPRGDKIAFTKRQGANFTIGVMNPDGSGERMVTSGGRDEGPTWAPNGRVLMYGREVGGSSQIWSVDVSGRNERRVSTPGSASDPAWSPLLP